VPPRAPILQHARVGTYFAAGTANRYLRLKSHTDMSANPIIANTDYAAAFSFESAGWIGNVPDRAELFDFLTELQRSLDVATLLEIFSLKLQAHYRHRGIRLETRCDGADETAREFVIGQSGGRRGLKNLLHVGEHELGWLEIFSATSPDDDQQRTIDRLLACLIHPLQNAVRFHRLSHQVMLDDLTGVGNRTALNRALSHEIARAERSGDGAGFALMLLDLDGFKALNDRHGHLVGDECLRQFARIVEKNLRDSDQLFRYGGDEFVIILPDANAAAGREIGERLQQRLVAECNAPAVRATIGVAQWRHGMTSQALINAADQAMYARKPQKRAVRPVC